MDVEAAVSLLDVNKGPDERVSKEIFMYLGSSYEIGNYRGLFKGEDVTADGCVYDPIVNNGLEKYPTSGFATYWYDLRDTGFTYRRNDAHKDVWDGWYAALIIYKQVKTPQTVADNFAAGVAGKNDVIMNLKKAKNDMEYDPDIDKESNEALSSAPLSADVEYTIAKVIAALCMRMMFRGGMGGLYLVFDDLDYDYTRENVLRCAAKFIMSVFNEGNSVSLHT